MIAFRTVAVLALDDSTLLYSALIARHHEFTVWHSSLNFGFQGISEADFIMPVNTNQVGPLVRSDLFHKAIDIGTKLAFDLRALALRV
jgi:hypothetical protein